MATPFLVGSAVLQGAATVGQFKAAGDAKKIGKQNAAAILAEARAQLDRLKIQQETVFGQAMSDYGASGLKMEGTVKQSMDVMAQRQAKERTDLWQAAQRRAALAKAEGASASRMGMANAFSSMAQIYPMFASRSGDGGTTQSAPGGGFFPMLPY